MRKKFPEPRLQGTGGGRAGEAPSEDPSLAAPHAPKPQELPERVLWKASTAPINGWLKKARNTADRALVRGGRWGRPAEHPQRPLVCNPARGPAQPCTQI